MNERKPSRRVSLDLPLSSEFEDLANPSTMSVTDIIKYSLKLYELFASEVKQGSKLRVISPEGVVKEIALTIPLDPMVASTIVDSIGEPVAFESPIYEHIVTDLAFVSEDLLRSVHSTPDAIYSLTPRQFEELVAELLVRQGYSVELTPQSKDGGLDIFVATKNSLGSFLYIVECKKFARDHPVGVELVRGLYGVVEQTRATAGILATTSRFTSGAREWQSTLEHRLSLRDYYDLRDWLHLALRGSVTQRTPNPGAAPDGWRRR